MKREAAATNHDIAYKCNQEDCVVAIFEAITDALDTQSHKQKVCEGVDNLSAVNGRVVILYRHC